MRRWLLFLFFPLTLGVFSTVAIWIGRQHPLPDRVAMLRLDMCQPPCLIGITPGLTKWDEAQQKIRQIFSEPRYKVLGSDGTYTIEDRVSQLAFTVQLDSADDVVISVALSFREIYKNDQWIHADKLVISFGELNTIWGNPRSIRVWSGYGNWIPYYNGWSGSHVVVEESTGFPETSARLTWNNPVRLIQMLDEQSKSSETNAWCWRGYLSYKQYGDKQYRC
jgi:hypothetical protein